MTAADPEVSSRARPTRELIADVGGAIALGVVLLPVAGVVVRWISFSVGQTVNHPLVLALAGSPAELAATALSSLLIGLALLPFIPFLGNLGRIQHHVDKVQQLARQSDAIPEKLEALKKKADAFKEQATPDAEVAKELIDQFETLGSEAVRLTTELERLSNPPTFPKLLRNPPRVFNPVLRFAESHQSLVRVGRARAAGHLLGFAHAFRPVAYHPCNCWDRSSSIGCTANSPQDRQNSA